MNLQYVFSNYDKEKIINSFLNNHLNKDIDFIYVAHATEKNKDYKVPPDTELEWLMFIKLSLRR